MDDAWTDMDKNKIQWTYFDLGSRVEETSEVKDGRLHIHYGSEGDPDTGTCTIRHLLQFEAWDGSIQIIGRFRSAHGAELRANEWLKNKESTNEVAKTEGQV